MEDPFFEERIVGLVVKHYTDHVEFLKALELCRKYPEAARADRITPVILAEWATFGRPDVDAYIAEHELSSELVADFEAQLARRNKGGKVTRERIKPSGQGSTNMEGEGR